MHYNFLIVTRFDTGVECRAALEHSTDMAVNAYFSHLGSNNRTLQDRAEEFGFDTFPLGENIAAGYNTVRDVVLAWMWWVYMLLSSRCHGVHHVQVKLTMLRCLQFCGSPNKPHGMWV